MIKNAKYSLMGLVIFTLACNIAGNHDHKTDSVQPVSAVLEADSGNLVKSEAPDAIAKTTRGYALPSSDGRLAQSPINILSESALKDTSRFIPIKFNAGITAIENLGHTIQLDFKSGSTVIEDGKTYSPKQFHFHTPSEHMIDGMTFPMEMHIVNVQQDTNIHADPHYLVVGLFFKMGRENKFIQEFLNKIPPEEGEKDTLPPGVVNFEDLFKTIPENDPGGYFSYKGSLTTPPYAETVTWIVKKYVLEASPEQITRIEKMEGDNARHVQGLYARKVVSH